MYAVGALMMKDNSFVTVRAPPKEAMLTCVIMALSHLREDAT
jgi:hypothetical protein